MNVEQYEVVRRKFVDSLQLAFIRMSPSRYSHRPGRSIRGGPATEPERTLSRFGGQTGGARGGLSALAGWTQLRSVLPARPDRPVISASSMSPCRASAALPSPAAALVSPAVAAACSAGVVTVVQSCRKASSCRRPAAGHAPDREGLPLARETFLLLRGGSQTVPVKARLAAAALIHGTSRPELSGAQAGDRRRRRIRWRLRTFRVPAGLTSRSSGRASGAAGRASAPGLLPGPAGRRPGRRFVRRDRL
jgi:hypothetical protein